MSHRCVARWGFIRTRVAGLFPHPASALRLVSAVLMEISEDWETGRVYFNMDAEKPARSP